MAAFSNSSTDRGTSYLSFDERQEFRREIMQMVMDLLGDRERSKIGFFYPNMPLR